MSPRATDQIAPEALAQAFIDPASGEMFFAHTPQQAATPRRRFFTPRRVVGVLLMLGMAAAVYWVVFLSDMADPLLAYVEPAKDLVVWVKEDPARMLAAAAAAIIPHIGLYALLFDDRLR